MQAYLAIKYHADGRNRPLLEAIAAALAANGIASVCIVRDLERWGAVAFSPPELMAEAFRQIANSDLVVIELTEKGIGLGIEAGYAYAQGIPIITVAPKGADISLTLQGISKQIFIYAKVEELTGCFAACKEVIRI